MSGVRHRSGATRSSNDDSPSSETESIGKREFAFQKEASHVHVGRIGIAWKLTGVAIGILIPLILGYYWSKYLKLLHENYLWFSNIGVRIELLVLINW
jgi:hypothetical protein